MRIFPFTIFALALAVLAIQPVRAADDEIKCDSDDELTKLESNQHDAEVLCSKAANLPECGNVLMQMKNSTKTLKDYLDKACKRVADLPKDLANRDSSTSQKEQAVAARDLWLGLKSDYTNYQQSLVQEFKKMHTVMRQEHGPLGPRVAIVPSLPAIQRTKEQIREALEKEDVMKKIAMPTHIEPNSGNITPSEFAARDGFRFMKRILKAKKEADTTLSQITMKTNSAQALVSELGKQPETKDNTTPAAATPTVSGGSGLDMKSIAGLATAGIGLAQAMKKSDSSVNGETPPAPVTPPGANAAAAPKETPSSKFGGNDKTAPSGPAFVVADNKKDPSVNHSGGGGSNGKEDSDISKNNLPPLVASNSGSPATAKLGGGGGGNGGGSGSEGSSAQGKRDPSGSGGEPKQEESLQGIGGGSLGGGGPPGGGSSMPGMPPDPAAAAAEAGMQDLLHDMKETAEGGEPPPEGGVQAAADIAMAAEDLFPRVSACLVRNLKLGKVLNGLGDRVSNNPEQNQ